MPPRRGRPAICLALCSLTALAATASAQSLPGTAEWTDRGDSKQAASAMVEGLHRWLDRELEASIPSREPKWNLDPSSLEAWEKSLAPHRARLRKLLGLVDDRGTTPAMELVGTTDSPAQIAESKNFRVLAVRWPVHPDVHAEGLLVEPRLEPRGQVVLLPDASQTPEQVVGLSKGLPPEQQVARLLAEAGFRVVVPALLDRNCTFSGSPTVRMTNLTHREWIWRQAFETGRHPIGYEVETVSAAIDWLKPKAPRVPIGVAGYGEGGLIALFAGAVDTRIDATWSAAAFGYSRDVWNQPIDRSVFGLLAEFGDAEIAQMIYPRGLVIEPCLGPEVNGPLPPVNGRSDAASGRLTAITWNEAEFAERVLRLQSKGTPKPTRTHTIYQPRGIFTSTWNQSDEARLMFVATLQNAQKSVTSPRPELPEASWTSKTGLPSNEDRQRRLVEGWTRHTQALLRPSELRRYDLWKTADWKSVDAWQSSTAPLREQLWTEVIGKLPPATEPLKPRTVQVLDQPRFTGHAIEIPVYPDVVASGILLLPKDLKPGEKRPVVVCQHGLEGTPQEVVDPSIKSVYNSFGAQLADRGYIVYAPQNPYIGVDRFRTLQRKLHPLGKSLFAVIIRQHERTLEWLKTLDNVDPARIGFYGLSYGGKTAMRVPAILTDYALSICSADFNEWAVKCTNLDRQYSYMFTIEYDMYEWDLASTFNYAELASLIAPRPFMVERGHDDAVAPDEWIGYEYAKVKRTYDRLNLPDRTEIGYFNAGHQIDGKATFAFLARHLNWPQGAAPPAP